MTFVELAQAIDNATAELAKTQLAVEAAELAHKALLEAHYAEQDAKAALVYNAKLTAKEAEAKVQSFINQMKTMMGVHSAPKPQPTTSDLKQLFLDGQKLRGK